MRFCTLGTDEIVEGKVKIIASALVHLMLSKRSVLYRKKTRAMRFNGREKPMSHRLGSQRPNLFERPAIDEQRSITS